MFCQVPTPRGRRKWGWRLNLTVSNAAKTKAVQEVFSGRKSSSSTSQQINQWKLKKKKGRRKTKERKQK